MPESSSLSLRKIFIFWMPLAATWIMMSVEGPLLAAIIARLADPKFNLAAYGVAFSFALIVEAPVIMMLSASTALVKDWASFCKLRNFTFILNGTLTLLLLILLIPSIFYFITKTLIGLPQNVADLTHLAMILLIPWPGAIGYRRFYQGILIRNNLTRRVAYGTVVRLLAVVTTSFSLFLIGKLPGVVVGAASLSSGVLMEGIASRFMVHSVLKELKMRPSKKDTEPLSYISIAKFYYPLALTPMIALGIQPIITFFMGQSKSSIESLAVFPVISSLVFIFRALGLSYQEVAISLMGEEGEGYIPLRNFTILLGISVVAGLSLIAFTPLSQVWFFQVSGLSKELTQFAKIPTMVFAIMPGLTVLLSFQRALLVYHRKTPPITWATVIEFSGIMAILFVSLKYFDMAGVLAAVFALVVGRFVANAYLFLVDRNLPDAANL
jgi:progressive ankylosis protein